MAESFDRVGLTKNWDIVTRILAPDKKALAVGKHGESADVGQEKEFEEALRSLDSAGMLPMVPAWFQQALQDDLRRRVSKEFWRFFDPIMHPELEVEECLPKQLVLSIDYLYNVMQTYNSAMRTLRKVQQLLSLKTLADESHLRSSSGKVKHSALGSAGGRDALALAGGKDALEDHLVLSLKSLIFNSFPSTFRKAVEVFYSQSFNVFRREELEESPEKGQTTNEILDRFSTVNKQLHSLGLLEHVAGSAINQAVTDHIRSCIYTACRGGFDTPYLEQLERYLDTKVMEWLREIYKYSEQTAQSIDSFRGRLMHFIYESYAEFIIDKLFIIIVEFPESEPTIKDLRRCLENIDLRSRLVESLRKNYELRLLHPGVNTADILTAYTSAIRALRALDPAGVILELVCEPLRRYLRWREDTVRCIVSSLTDTESNDLMDELLRGAPQPIDTRSESDDETESWELWEPDPVDANPDTASKRRKEQDIISTLVNVYGSKELFVCEYRTLLADRLLSPNYSNLSSAMAGGDMDRELRYLELLKLRFGEAALHFCQVMLKDVSDSRRINARIAEIKQQNGDTADPELNALILSAQFWPAFREEKITLPPELQRHLDNYTQQYEMLKGNRTLVWQPHLGCMVVELELKDQTLTFNVSPSQAALIMQFQNQKQWMVEELGQALEMPPCVVRRRLAFWQGQGLLKELETDVFELVEERRLTPQEVILVDDTEEEVQSAMASAAQQREQEMQMFWTYILGMLQNLDCLPLERINAMLRMFAVQGPESGFTQQDLKEFLDRKVQEQKLVFSAGVYRLPKN